jgi:TPR repeat protein
VTGRGVPRDDAQAVIWYRRAAERGDIAGERGLGLMYLEGRGVPQDLTLASQWLKLVAQPQTMPIKP